MSKKNQTIMLGFHSPVDGRLMREWLTGSGYKVVESLDDTAGIDLVLMDSATARRIMNKAFGLKKSAKYFFPVLICINAGEEVDPWLKTGFDDVLHLPASKVEWKTRIETMLHLRRQSEELGRKSETSLIYTLENMSDGFVSLDKNWHYTYVNKKAGEMFDRKPEDLVGKHIWTEFPEGIGQPFYKNYYKAVETQKAISFEDYYSPWDRWYENRVLPSPMGLSIFFHDITDRKLAEEKLKAKNQQIIVSEKTLRESEEKFRKAFTTSPDSININRLDDGMYISINDGYTEITGYSESDVIGKTSLEINIWVNPGDREKLVEGLRKHGQIQNLEAQFRMKDGKIVYGLMSATVITLNDVPHIISITRDITQKKQAEEALVNSKNRYQSLFDNSPIPLWEEDFSEVKKFIGLLKQDNVKDFKTYFKNHPDKVLACSQMIKITDVNNAVLKLHEATLKEDLLDGLPSIFTKKSYEAFTQEIIAIAEGNNIQGLEGSVKTLKGKEKEVSIKWMIVPGYEDTMEKVYLSTTDITDRKRDEKEKQDLQEQLNHKSKMDAIGEPAGGMAHDFNNVLNGIMSAAELLQLPKQGLNEKSLKYVDLIIQSSRRASDLISKLLTFGHKGHIARSTFNIHKVLNETVDILKETIDRKITISLTEEAYNQYLIGDISAMESAFLNLGINASHAMPDGGEIRINTKNMFLDQMFCDSSSFEITPGDFIQIVIKDSGCGITEENLQKIFDPFFTTKGQGKGTGLGLSAVYGTIQNHHGAIEVHSSVGIGTTFYILLPCSGESAHQIEEKDQPVKGAGTILLVDDEEFNRILNGEILETLGYQIILAEDGQEAVEIFKEKHTEIDIVLMDMIMPEMNGSEAFYKMKEIDKNCHVIIASGYTKDERIEELLGNGVKGFIRKPYKISEISQVLDKVYKEQR